MTRGKDKVFVRGNTFAYSKFNKDNKEGKYCVTCGKWKTSKLYFRASVICIECN